MDSEPVAEPVSIAAYLAIFSAVYVGLTTLFKLLLPAFYVNLESGESGVVVGAGLAAMVKFVNDHGRPPLESEKTKLVRLSVLSSLALSLLFSAVTLPAMDGNDTLGAPSELFSGSLPLAWAGLMLTGIFVDYLLLHLNFGWGARFYLYRLKKLRI